MKIVNDIVDNGILINHDYQPQTGENAISAEALIQNLNLVEAQIASKPETHDFSQGFMAGLLLGSQRPEEMFSVISEIVKQVGVEKLMPYQDIGDAIMGEHNLTLCEKHRGEQE